MSGRGEKYTRNVAQRVNRRAVVGGSIGGVEWMSEDERQYQARVDLELAGSRLDQVLPQLFPEFSRTRLQQWVRAGRVSCNGEAVTRPRQKLFGGETLGLRAQL